MAFLITFNGNFAATASMINNGTLRIIDPEMPQTVAYVHNDGSNKAINAWYLAENGQQESDIDTLYNPASTTQLSGSFLYSIVQVLNNSQVVVEPISGEGSFGGIALAIEQLSRLIFKVAPQNNPTPTGVLAYQLLSPGNNGFSAVTNFTASFIQPTAVIPTERSQSFARIILNNLEPATGDVYAVSYTHLTLPTKRIV